MLIKKKFLNLNLSGEAKIQYQKVTSISLEKQKRSSHKYPHASQSQRSDRISAQCTLATKQEGKHENGQVMKDLKRQHCWRLSQDFVLLLPPSVCEGSTLMLPDKAQSSPSSSPPPWKTFSSLCCPTSNFSPSLSSAAASRIQQTPFHISL